jgi:hypothetical protein
MFSSFAAHVVIHIVLIRYYDQIQQKPFKYHQFITNHTSEGHFLQLFCLSFSLYIAQGLTFATWITRNVTKEWLQSEIGSAILLTLAKYFTGNLLIKVHMCNENTFPDISSYITANAEQTSPYFCQYKITRWRKISPYNSVPIFCKLSVTFCESSTSRKPHADQMYSATVPFTDFVRFQRKSVGWSSDWRSHCPWIFHETVLFSFLQASRESKAVNLFIDHHKRSECYIASFCSLLCPLRGKIITSMYWSKIIC